MRQRGRPGTGQIRRQLRADGLTTFSLRVRAYGKRHTIRLGTELDGWTEARAEIELANVCAQIRAGTWSPPGKHTETGEVPTFHEYASAWLRRRVAEGLGENTRKDYLWRLSSHLLPFLASYRVDEITDDVVEAFKEHKLDERATIIAAEDAGEQIRDRNGRARRALSNESINKLLVLLTRVLEPAVRRGWLPHNPAASVQRLRVPRRKGAILEADELESLITAARPRARCATGTSERRRLVRELRDQEKKLSWREIGDRLGIASSTAVYLYRAAPAPIVHDGRRALVAVLGCGGLRVSEAAALNIADIDLAHRKIYVRDSKTDAGVREVDMTPRLVDELVAYLATRDKPVPAIRRSRRERARVATRTTSATVSWRRPSSGPTLSARRPGCPRSASRSRPTHCGAPTSACCCPPAPKCRTCRRRSATVTRRSRSRSTRIVLKRRDRSRLGDAFDALMRDAIPSMQHAKMLNRGWQSSANDGSPAAPDRRVVRRIWAHNWAGRTAHDVPMHEAHTAQNEERPANTGLPSDGRGGFRTCDLSRVKRALSH